MLFYKTFGSCPLKSKPSIIFLHGFLGSHLDWIPIIKCLEKRFYCIAVDLPAHGKTPFCEDVISTVEETLLSLCDHETWIVGYSLGGRLALGYGQKKPQTINGIIAISSHIGLSNSEERDKRKQQDLIWKNRLETLDTKDFLKLWYQQPVFTSLQKKTELLNELMIRRTYTNPTELAHVFHQVSLSKQALYQRFQHPVQFLYGEQDELYAHLYSNLPSEMAKKISDAGHAIHLENPKGCIQAIELFVNKNKKNL